MPKKLVRAVSLNEQQPEEKEEQVVEETSQESEPNEEQEQEQEQEATNNDDVNSEDLDNLVKEYTKQRKQKKKDVEPKSECQNCGKVMSSKSLKYSHAKNCKNKPVPIPEPPSMPPSPVEKPKLPRKTIAKKKKVEKQEVTFEARKVEDHDTNNNLTTNYVQLMELQKRARALHKQERMKNLASQAF